MNLGFQALDFDIAHGSYTNIVLTFSEIFKSVLILLVNKNLREQFQKIRAQRPHAKRLNIESCIKTSDSLLSAHWQRRSKQAAFFARIEGELLYMF